MTTAPKPLPFAGTPEELEKYLLEFARLTRAVAARQPKTGWLVSGGASLSTNPNTIPWTLDVTRAEGGLVLGHRIGRVPWTRAKSARIAAYREGQLADYLTARVRGSGPEKFDLLRLREPFSAAGAGVAAATASLAWTIATGLAGFAFAYVSAVIASIPLLSVSICEIAAHSAALQQAGAIPLPSPAEAASTGAFGAAAVFAVPIAFFTGLVHWIALAASDLGFRAMRVPQASCFFQVFMIAWAFWPFVSAAAIPLALLVPAATHLGASLVWSRRRERIREGPRPARAVVLIAVILAASLAGVVVPHVKPWKENLPKIALFRDAWLLGHPAGRAIASAYYRYTLYSAEAVKEFYSIDPGRAARSQPIAACADPSVATRLRVLHVTVTAPGAPADAVVGPGTIAPGRDLAELKLALDDYSRRTFRGGGLRDLASMGWMSIYYAGPLVVLVVLMGCFAPLVSLLFRKVSPKTALVALSGVTMVATLALVLATADRPQNVDAEAFADARPHRRHEAAVRAFEMESTAPLADALLKASDDPDLRVRLWAVAALGKSGDPRALPKLVERLDDPEFFVRYRAAEGLRFFKDPKAVKPLVRMMRERSWYEGLYALEALRAIQPGRF